MIWARFLVLPEVPLLKRGEDAGEQRDNFHLFERKGLHCGVVVFWLALSPSLSRFLPATAYKRNGLAEFQDSR